jgi:hypothetical protein
MLAYRDNLLESRRQAIQADIDTRKSAAERNRLGQFATPNALAIDIARYVQSVLGPTKCNIACRPFNRLGQFLFAALLSSAQRIDSAVGSSSIRPAEPPAIWGQCRT